MFNKFRKTEETPLEEEIARLTNSLSMVDPTEEEYATIKQHLQDLHALSQKEKRKKISGDAMVAAAASIGGILIMVAYEHSHVISSKATNFIHKPKIDQS